MNVVTGKDPLGAWMTEHPVLRKISFTGSGDAGAGWQRPGDSARRRRPRCCRPETLYPRGRTAIQRYEPAEEVANLVAFLASDAASATVGVMVDMGGGMSI
nr:hypothetical protein GCM10020063_001400 [Dactylosporangium thailandense]